MLIRLRGGNAGGQGRFPKLGIAGGFLRQGREENLLAGIEKAESPAFQQRLIAFRQLLQTVGGRTVIAAAL